MYRTNTCRGLGILTLAAGLALAGGAVRGALAETTTAQAPVATAKATLLAGSTAATVQKVALRAPNWRYRYHNGRWWYWTTGNYWMVYNNGWHRHNAYRSGNPYYGYGDRRYDRYRSGYRGYPYPNRYYRPGPNYRGNYYYRGPGAGIGFGLGF